jgi:hypothetical protein
MSERNEAGISEASGRGERWTRRVLLGRLGSTGLAATAGLGLASLIGSATAQASVAPPMQIKHGPDCDACIYCVRDEYTCGPGGCGSGSCCYHCTGCGYNYHACYYTGDGCATISFYTCP